MGQVNAISVISFLSPQGSVQMSPFIFGPGFLSRCLLQVLLRLLPHCLKCPLWFLPSHVSLVWQIFAMFYAWPSHHDLLAFIVEVANSSSYKYGFPCWLWLSSLHYDEINNSFQDSTSVILQLFSSCLWGVQSFWS